MAAMDDLTFKVNFTGEGAERLRVAVKEKLKEFMGDYTDDTLVEYVVVLLRNGRRKEEARNELDVFLGDDSSSFISWLWDHLAANLELYVKPHEPDGNVRTKLKPLIVDQAANVGSLSLSVKKEDGKSGNPSRSRHDREWKDLVRDAGEPPPLRSTEIEKIPADEEARVWDRRAKRSVSPQYYQEKKRKRNNEKPHVKREPTSIDAPRRLLQFAVRDAVAMSRTSESAVGQAPNRLRSVLSTISSDVDHPQKVHSIARVRNPMSTVIKAVAEAAHDVQKVRPSGNVFDRLSCALDIPASHVPDHNYPTNTRPAGYGDFSEIPPQTHLQKHEYSQRYVEDVMGLENETNLMYEDASDHEGFDDPNIIGRSDISQVDILDGSRGENFCTILGSNSMSEDADNGMKPMRHKYLHPPNTESPLKKDSVKANVPKQSHGRILKKIDEQTSLKHLRENSAVASTGVAEVETSKHSVTNGNGTCSSSTPEETKKLLLPISGSFSAVHSLEDSDSRTIFVSNVHSTATKDSLYQHFNKFGELIKVVINTDATTGKSIGSAVIEFTHKDAADNALALNGTTFLSRIIKVVKRSSSLQQAPLMGWPRVVRASPYARFSWGPYVRGIPASFRSRPPIRLGARSLQWKRDSQVTSAESAGCVSSPVMSVARKFTYVRTEPKPVSSVGSICVPRLG